MDDRDQERNLRVLSFDDNDPPEDTVRPSKEALWRPAFLKVLANTANVRAACQAAGVTRAQVDKTRARSPRFNALCEEALADAADALEAIAWKRVQEGSDAVLMFMLRGAKPEKYREGYKEPWRGHLTVSGPGGGPIEHQGRTKLSEEEEAGRTLRALAEAKMIEGPTPEELNEAQQVIEGEYEVVSR
jgi:hypothetical protein